MLPEQREGRETFTPHTDLKAESPHGLRTRFLTTLASATVIATTAFLALPGISHASELYTHSDVLFNAYAGAILGSMLGGGVYYTWVSLGYGGFNKIRDMKNLLISACAVGVIGAAAGYLLTR